MESVDPGESLQEECLTPQSASKEKALSLQAFLIFCQVRRGNCPQQ